MVELPFGGKAAICTEDTVNLDGSPFNNIGYSPDITVKYFLCDYLKKGTVIDKEFPISKEILNKDIN